MATRRYEQRLRAQSAEETRRTILDALYGVLTAAPTKPASVDAVARNAGVARSTVYVVFGDRAGLFHAFTRDLLERGGFAGVLKAVADPDPRVTVRDGITAGCHTFAAHRDVLRALVSMAALDPAAVGDVMAEQERERAGGMRRLARRLADGGHLRDGLTAKQAADRLWVLTSFDAFDLLYAGRDLSAARVAEVLVDLAERTLLA
jgi:AcrR family transcriptional regulator